MKKIALILIFGIVFISCSDDDNTNTQTNEETSVTLNFTQNFDGTVISEQDLSTTAYTNANGEDITISRLRYLITDITFTNSNAIPVEVEDYNLVWLETGSTEGLSITPEGKLPPGDYDVTMRFGFTETNNTSTAYPDLNAKSWNVPQPLGGGYHYQQMDGTFIDTAGDQQPFNFHTISAPVNPMTDMVTREDTSIAINLGTITIGGINTSIEVQANIAQWFKNPNQWDLNVLNTVLMPNYNAQIMMNQNGQNVFSIGEVVVTE